MQPSRSVMMDKERVVFMTVLVVLFASLLLFGGLGTLGVDALSTWQDFVGWALAEMFLFMASAHFARTKEDLINIVPKASPNPRILCA